MALHWQHDSHCSGSAVPSCQQPWCCAAMWEVMFKGALLQVAEDCPCYTVSPVALSRRCTIHSHSG